MAYSKYVTEFKDEDNTVYGIMDEEATAAVSKLKSAFAAMGLVVYNGQFYINPDGNTLPA